MNDNQTTPLIECQWHHIWNLHIGFTEVYYYCTCCNKQIDVPHADAPVPIEVKQDRARKIGNQAYGTD